MLDLDEFMPGVYQVDPEVLIEMPGIQVESILPAAIEVEVTEPQS